MASGLKCMNCKSHVPEGEAKFFGQVFVCETCFTIASRFYERLQRELKQTLVVAKDAIRVALVQGKFHLSEAQRQGVSKKEVLEAILRMEELKNEHDTSKGCPEKIPTSPLPTQPTKSGESTPPHVSTLAALGRSSSTKPSPQD